VSAALISDGAAKAGVANEKTATSVIGAARFAAQKKVVPPWCPGWSFMDRPLGFVAGEGFNGSV
jgi:hypothetical protein